jgi:hypothetical protein
MTTNPMVLFMMLTGGLSFGVGIGLCIHVAVVRSWIRNGFMTFQGIVFAIKRVR